jgi:aryl-alcohol dehydrogenase-like predicted oxidoreductase
MQRRRLGRLGHDSSVLLYGGAALGEVSQEVADASVQEALEAGINHFDVAADYGEAELRLGALMSGLRSRVFLATKTGLRDREPAWAQVNASLERLRTDSVDLLQLHAVGDLDELDLVTRPGGALEAAVRAQQEGLVGAVGITGHGRQATATHLEALRRFPFATVLTPLNAVLWCDPGFREPYLALVEEVRRQDVGLMTIKTVARRNYPGVGAGQQLGEQAFTTWYEPLADPEPIRAAVSWVLGHEEITGFATPGDVRLLRHVIRAERERLAPADAEAALATVEDYSSPFTAMPAGL